MDARTLNPNLVTDETDRSDGMCDKPSVQIRDVRQAVVQTRFPEDSRGLPPPMHPPGSSPLPVRSPPRGETGDYRNSIPITAVSARRMLEQLETDLCLSLNRLDEAKMRSVLLIEYHASANDRTAERLSLHLAARW